MVSTFIWTIGHFRDSTQRYQCVEPRALDVILWNLQKLPSNPSEEVKQRRALSSSGYSECSLYSFPLFLVLVGISSGKIDESTDNSNIRESISNNFCPISLINFKDKYNFKLTAKTETLKLLLIFENYFCYKVIMYGT